MAKVITVTNQKGGTGKTTTAAALAAGLSARGYKTLLIDLDAQGNLSYSMSAKLGGASSMGVLMGELPALDAIQHTPSGDIIASSPALSGADSLLSETGKEYKLLEALDAIQELYDYCIIDTPPALGIITVNALTACNKGIIIPAQADSYSLQGINQLHNTIQTVRKYCNKALYIRGIVLTRFNGRSIIRREIADALTTTAEQFNTKLYKTRIRECTALVEAQTVRKTIFQYAPKSNAAADYNALIDEFLQEE